MKESARSFGRGAILVVTLGMLVSVCSSGEQPEPRAPTSRAESEGSSAVPYSWARYYDAGAPAPLRATAYGTIEVTFDETGRPVGKSIPNNDRHYAVFSYESGDLVRIEERQGRPDGRCRDRRRYEFSTSEEPDRVLTDWDCDGDWETVTDQSGYRRTLSCSDRLRWAP